jgi:hypothetical protein
MSKIVVPFEVRESLKNLIQPIEWCYSEGHSFGVFTPRQSENAPLL